ncbi:hypothetical protein PCANC_14399 [Puccinia coronata f. sp. avenae]|uniref:Uncharacterized protein n=1 Tax=Puccinia coronata f. sp. avenae TaxID=200324 RepID=A0A2N5UZE2_9BASI|nr:hypothetical protein PCANC_14399 [Puccinia coronata f. sp. avenae]
MASTPHLTTHNLAVLQLAFKTGPISTHPVLQQFFNQLPNTMNPTTRNHVLVAETQIFRMTQVDNLDGNPDSNAPLGAANQSATTTNASPVVTVALATPAITATTLTAAIPAPATAPAVPRRRAPPSTARSVRLSIEYIIWLSASLPASVKKSAGSGRGKAPPEWTKVVSKLPLPNWQLVPTNWDWGLAKRKLTLLAGASRPYLTEAITKNDNECLVTWQAVITSDHTYGSSKKAFINTKEDWTKFAKAAELAYPAQAISIRIHQQDPRSIARDQTTDAEANAMLIMLNGTQEERAPLEQTRACLTANPNTKVENPATSHAVNLRKHHLMKRLERGAPSSEGEFAMHPSGDGRWIRLGHKALWAWAYKLSCKDPNVDLDVPPASPLFEWQSADSFKPASKRKVAPASDVTGSPASQVFRPTPWGTPNTLADFSTNHTESADLVEVLRGTRASSSIKIPRGLTQYDQSRQTGPLAVPRGRPVVSPVNLAGLNHLCIGEAAADNDQTGELLSIPDFLDFCGIKSDDFHTKWLIRNHNITTWTHFRDSDKDDIIGHGIKAGPARLIYRGARKIDGMSLDDESRDVSPEV